MEYISPNMLELLIKGLKISNNLIIQIPKNSYVQEVIELIYRAGFSSKKTLLYL